MVFGDSRAASGFGCKAAALTFVAQPQLPLPTRPTQPTAGPFPHSPNPSYGQCLRLRRRLTPTYLLLSDYG